MLERHFLTDELFPAEAALYKYKDRETPTQFQKGSRHKAFDILSDGDLQAKIVFPRAPDNSEQQTHVPLTFDGVTQRPTHSVYGWYVHGCEAAEEQWSNMRCVTENEAQRRLEKSKAYKRFNHLPFKLERRVNGIVALWAVRAYFVGPDTSKAPPYVVVLCSDLSVSKWLVDDLSRQLSRNYKNWYATRLPDVKVLKYGSGNGHSSPEKPAAEETEDSEPQVIRVSLDSYYPTMLNGQLSTWTQRRHRCGIRLEVTRGSESLRYGTIGGIININGRLFGLTAGHIFSPQAGDADVEGTSISTAEHWAQIGEDAMRWQQHGFYSMSLDWALVYLPELQGLNAGAWDDINLVQTAGGDFRPVLVAIDEPGPGRPVVMATPGCTYGLRGVFVGSEAVINIPASNAPYSVWALRMEAPWLIQEGDSGSWAFDAITGNLLGILVAGCPDLLEAYILPACRVFDEIRSRNNRCVMLPNSYPISKNAHLELNQLIRSYDALLSRTISRYKSGRLPIRLQTDTEELELKMANFCERNTSISKGLPREKYLPWTGQDMLAWQRRWWELGPGDVDFASRDWTSWAQTSMHQSRLQYYNSMNERWRALLLDFPRSSNMIQPYRDRIVRRRVSLRVAWNYLILGKDGDSPTNSSKLFYKYSDIDSAAIEDELRSQFYSESPPFTAMRPLDRTTLRHSFKYMQRYLQDRIKDAKMPAEIRMKEIDELEDIERDDPVCLFGAVVLNKDKTHVSVVMPPSSVGPQLSITPVRLWKGEIDRRLEVKRGSVRYSPCRLPLGVWDRTRSEDTNIARLFKDQLGLEGVTWQRKELDWEPDDLYYLPRQNRDVTVKLYEIIASENEWRCNSSNWMGWPVIMRSYRELQGLEMHHLFNGALERSSIVKDDV